MNWSEKKDIFIAVSSDYRELYKADIFRTLVKPTEAIEHFRYQRQWISDELRNHNKSQLVGQNVVLVYKHVETANSPIYIPIRTAKIIDFVYDIETKVFHYYFRLGGFCDIKEPLQYNDEVFLFKANQIQVINDIWINKIKAVKGYFANHFFFKINSLKDERGKLLKTNYNRINNSYYYKFLHGKSYTLEISIANPNESQNTLTISSSSPDVNVVLTEKYFISAPFDILKIPITTRSLDVYRERSFLSFIINNAEDKKVKEYENHIHINKTMSKYKPWWFGILTAILIGSTWLLKDRTDSIENIFTHENIHARDIHFDYFAFFYIVAIIVSSAFLYRFFNKK